MFNMYINACTLEVTIFIDFSSNLVQTFHSETSNRYYKFAITTGTRGGGRFPENFGFVALSSPFRETLYYLKLLNKL